MYWSWLKSKTLWANVIGIVVIVMTYWGIESPVVTEVSAVLLAIVNLILRVAFGEAPGTIIVPKTISDLVEGVIASPNLDTVATAKALSEAAIVSEVGDADSQ